MVVSGTSLIAATYGLVRGAHGLVLPAVQRDLGLTSASAGVVSGLTSVSYCVAAMLAMLSCQRHPRAVVLAAGAAGALGATGVAAAQNVGQFAAAVVLGSAGAGAASPALVVLVARAVVVARASAAQSLVNAGPGPGLVVAGLLALWTGQQWRAAWVVAAVATALATAWTLRAARDLALPDDPGGSRLDLSRAWLTPALGAFFFGSGSAAVWTYGRSVLEQSGVAPVDAILAWVALGVGVALSAPLTPLLLRRGLAPAWVASLGATAAATAVLAVADDRWTGWATTLVFGVGFTAGTTVLIAWAVRVSQTPGAAASAFFVAAMLGQAAGAPVVGSLVEHGPRTAFLLAAAATFAGSFAALPQRSRRLPLGPPQVTHQVSRLRALHAFYS